MPDGAVVTVFAEQQGEAVRLPPHLQAELEAAIDEADLEVGISGEELFEQLKKYR